MLRGLKELKGYIILATDGEIGRVHDFYLDAQDWAIRYLVVDTGAWLVGRRVLISPTALNQPDWQQKRLPVSLTQAQVENSPGIDMDKPVSRQQETELHAYYNWPPYWDSATLLLLGAGGLAPVAPLPPISPSGVEAEVVEKALLEETSGDPHLHSANEVIGYQVRARDDDIGHVTDFVIDDESLTWAIQYMIVDIGSWLPSKKVRLTPNWVKTISWTERTVEMDLQRETIANSPEYEGEFQ
jgi:sporulation protein YlmC with PRC-barrel domain